MYRSAATFSTILFDIYCFSINNLNITAIKMMKLMQRVQHEKLCNFYAMRPPSKYVNLFSINTYLSLSPTTVRTYSLWVHVFTRSLIHTILRENFLSIKIRERAKYEEIEKTTWVKNCRSTH